MQYVPPLPEVKGTVHERADGRTQHTQLHPDLGAPVNTAIIDHIIIPSGKSTPIGVSIYQHYFTYRGTQHIHLEI